MNKLLILITCILVAGCSNKGGGLAATETLSDEDFSVQCVGGFEYYVRVVPYHTYMAPKFDRETALPSRCEERPSTLNF